MQKIGRNPKEGKKIKRSQKRKEKKERKKRNKENQEKDVPYILGLRFDIKTKQKP